MSQLGNRLKQLRNTASIYEVEKAIGINRSVLSRYERGKVTPTLDTLKKLANHFKVPYKELLKLYFEEVYPHLEERKILFEWLSEQFKK